MTTAKDYLAIDLGAESGRAIVGRIEGGHLSLKEVHRFPNVAVHLPDGLHWDTLRLWTDIKQGIAAAVQETDGKLESVGIDTWGVDFGLLDRDDVLIGNPYQYRDSRTDGMFEEAFKRVSRAEIFDQTGIQFLTLNSLYQLLSMVISNSPALEIAQTFLPMPDLFNFWLTGRKVSEFSIATTTQCYDSRKENWAWPMLEEMGIPTHIFPEVVPSGAILGPLRPDLAEEVGTTDLLVIAPACHDTGSAVAGAPAETPDFAWVSSGTWSIMGAELPAPIVNSQSLAFNVTNEGGFGHTSRFCRNIMGLWLVQECRRTWARQGEELSYQEITEMAAQAAPLRSIIDPDQEDFFKPGDMPARIQAFCQRTGQPIPQSKGEIVRCALESLALKYRWVLERVEEILGRQLEPIHIVGGGTQNRLLSQFAADAIGRQVITGPIEATAAGNIIVQAIALDHVASLSAGREIVRNSFEVLKFQPINRKGWDKAYDKLLDMVE